MDIFRTEILEKILDLGAIKQRVISHNLANIDTPGYKEKVFSFEKQLREALDINGTLKMAVTDKKHIAPQNILEQVQGVHGESNSPSLRNDGNNVDIDREMVELAKNTLLFSGASRLISTKFSMLENAIKEGRR